MKCPKCGCERFMIAAREIYHQDYFAHIEDDGSIETYSLGNGNCYSDPEFSNIATCCECEETVGVPGQLSDEKQNAIRQRAINKWEIPGLYILNHAKVEQGVDGYRHGYYVDACVWVGEEEV